jgi:hypothetical protein
MKYYKQSSTSVFLTLYIISHALTGYPVPKVEAVLPKKIQKIFVPDVNNSLPVEPNVNNFPSWNPNSPNSPSLRYLQPNVTPSWNPNSSNSSSLTEQNRKELEIIPHQKSSPSFLIINKTALDAATYAFFKENSKLAMDILSKETINVTDHYRCIASNDGKERITCLLVIVSSSTIFISSVIAPFMQVKK